MRYITRYGMMNGILRLAALSALGFQSVYGLNEPSCDGSTADKLVQQVEVFNSKLESYASLVANGPATTSHLKLLDRREAKPTDARFAAPEHTAAKSNHNEQQHTVAEAKKIDTKLPLHAAQKPASSQGHVHTVIVTKQPQEQIHFSTYIPVEEQRHQSMLKESLESLTQQQAVLDSMQNACIPTSHKPKLITALSKTFSLYLVHHKNLEAAGSLVKRAQRPQAAGWLTMGNDVNSGYNGDEAELTSISTSSTSTSPAWGYGYPGGYPNYPPPQYSPQYITITVSPSTVNPPKATDTGDSSDDGGDDDDDGSDSSDSSTPSSTTPAPAPAPLPSTHHGIVYESTIGLVLGTFHLVEHLFGFGKSRQDLPGPSSALSELAEKVANVYKLKL